MSEEDTDDKPFDPSQRKLDEARRKGEIARAPEVNTAATYAGLLLAALVAGPAMLIAAGQMGQSILEQADRLSSQLSAGGRAGIAPILSGFSTNFLPLFALPFLAVVLVLIAQRGIVFAPEKLMPKASRLSPIATAKQKFGRDGLFTFAMSAIKMLAVSVILALHLNARSEEILGSLMLSPGAGITIMLQLMVEFLALIFILSAVMGAVDFFWQKAEHHRRNRMSYKEMMDEVKDSEGDPHTKGQRRQRGQDIAMNRMLQDVAKADVVIVNPTHYAVALRWKRGDSTAPICVAKGVDELAARIRERAALAGIPLHSDPPTARAIFSAVEVGSPIRPEHYKPVAAAIRFAEALKRHRRGSK